MKKKDHHFLLVRKYTRGFLSLMCIFYTLFLGGIGYHHLSFSYFIQSAMDSSSRATIGSLLSVWFTVFPIYLLFKNLLEPTKTMFKGIKSIIRSLGKSFLFIGIFGYVDLIVKNQVNISFLRIGLALLVFFFLYSKWDRLKDRSLSSSYSLYQGRRNLEYLQLKEVKKEVKMTKRPGIVDNYLEINSVSYRIRYSFFHLSVTEKKSHLREQNVYEGCMTNIFFSMFFFLLSIHGMIRETFYFPYLSIIAMSMCLLYTEKDRFLSFLKKILREGKQLLSDLKNN